MKRQKVVERKEEKIKIVEEQLLATVKHKILAMENESIQKIFKK